MIDKVLIDLRTTTLTLGELITRAHQYRAIYPDAEIFLGGDQHALIARFRDGVTA